MIYIYVHSADCFRLYNGFKGGSYLICQQAASSTFSYSRGSVHMALEMLSTYRQCIHCLATVNSEEENYKIVTARENNE